MPKLQTSKKGFTLIELLITIAILAILMAVVVVVLNPVERFNEARDSNAKNVLTRVAEAVETCYSVRQARIPPGTYLNCDTLTELKAGYLKTNFAFPTGGNSFAYNATATSYCIEYLLQAASKENVYWMYSTNDGVSKAHATGCGTVTNY